MLVPFTTLAWLTEVLLPFNLLPPPPTRSRRSIRIHDPLPDDPKTSLTPYAFHSNLQRHATAQSFFPAVSSSSGIQPSHLPGKEPPLPGTMNGNRPSFPAVVVLTIPLFLCLPQTLVAAFNIYDRVPSSLRGLGYRSGGSLVRRSEVPAVGYYSPPEDGGYMLTVSAPSLLLRAALGGPCPGYGHLAA